MTIFRCWSYCRLNSKTHSFSCSLFWAVPAFNRGQRFLAHRSAKLFLPYSFWVGRTAFPIPRSAATSPGWPHGWTLVLPCSARFRKYNRVWSFCSRFRVATARSCLWHSPQRLNRGDSEVRICLMNGTAFLKSFWTISAVLSLDGTIAPCTSSAQLLNQSSIAQIRSDL